MRKTLGRSNALKMIGFSASDGRKLEVLIDLISQLRSDLLLQRGIADFVRLPPPFLGVSSLNLAAPSPGAAVFLWAGRFFWGRALAPVD